MAALGLWPTEATPSTPAEVVGRLLAMQAQEHPYARWSVGQRMSAESGTASVVDAAFDAGEFLRTHVLPGTTCAGSCG
jgi:hypothetical protein